MNPIVCNTGPILHLQEAGLLELLKKSGAIYIPEVVDIELNELYPQWENTRPDWLHVEPLSPPETSQAKLLSSSGLQDLGEAAAIILSKRAAPWVSCYGLPPWATLIMTNHNQPSTDFPKHPCGFQRLSCLRLVRHWKRYLIKNKSERAGNQQK